MINAGWVGSVQTNIYNIYFESSAIEKKNYLGINFQ